eukprot:TRINITY_DN6139_c0_g1_i1.p1 TRINITY_DN6139_c0_g1~~TRINITY_DN6139_c0_g1_i1.p1  ORF type:complete len:605 (-),score=101.64 TRINITY_DN6139_c0_g1_i1:324-2138(-)
MESVHGKVIFLEHLPDIQFEKSTRGVLLLIFANGDAFFFPLEDEPEKNKEFGKNGKGIQESRLNLLPHYKVFTFPFYPEPGGTGSFYEPKRIVLSPDKTHLLLTGVLLRNLNCLAVYQIHDNPEYQEYFKIVYYDLNSTYIDACFIPDSLGLVAVLSKYPSLLFLIQFPWKEQLNNSRNHAYALVGENEIYKVVDTNPRVGGPIQIIGPALGVWNQPFRISHVAANIVCSDCFEDEESDVFDLITWNDFGCGEYVLWKLKRGKAGGVLGGSLKFEWYPRLLISKFFDKQWAEAEETPKVFIEEMQFSCSPVDNRILVLMRRVNFKGQNNGIGLYMVTPEGKAVEYKTSTEGRKGGNGEEENRLLNELCWYKVTDSLDVKEISCVKWTNSFLLGNHMGCAVVVKGVGLYELYENYFGSTFQSLNDGFAKNISNFVQVGQNKRYWVSSQGTLRYMEGSNKSFLPNFEWEEVVTKTSDLNNIIRLRKIGYFSQDLRQEMQPLVETLMNTKHDKKNKKNEKPEDLNGKQTITGTGDIESFYCLHLYKCWYCNQVLLKPLQCSGCLCVVYCSKACQAQHWKEEHKFVCLKIYESLLAAYVSKDSLQDGH